MNISTAPRPGRSQSSHLTERHTMRTALITAAALAALLLGGAGTASATPRHCTVFTHVCYPPQFPAHVPPRQIGGGRPPILP